MKNTHNPKLLQNRSCAQYFLMHRGQKSCLRLAHKQDSCYLKHSFQWQFSKSVRKLFVSKTFAYYCTHLSLIIDTAGTTTLKVLHPNYLQREKTETPKGMAGYPPGPGYPPASMYPPQRQQASLPVSKVELHISCTNLLKMDVTSSSDPMAILYMQEKKSKKWMEVCMR